MSLRFSGVLALFSATCIASAPVSAQDQYEGNIYPKRVDITRFIHVYDGDDTVRLGEMSVQLFFDVQTDYVYPTVEITPSEITVNWVDAKSVAEYKTAFPGREPNFTNTSQASAESAILSRAESSINAIRGEVREQLPESFQPGAQRIAFTAFDRSCEVTLYISEGGNRGDALGENRVEEC